MPTYSYACTACEHRFDTKQAFTDSSLTDCPECSGRLRKLFASVGVVFKGSGFYRTDSRAAAANESGSEGKTKSESTSDSKSDAKTGTSNGTSSGSSDSSSGSAGAASSSTKSSSASAAAS